MLVWCAQMDLNHRRLLNVGLKGHSLRPLGTWAHKIRKRWDSNSRRLLYLFGFQDRHHKPLGHASKCGGKKGTWTLTLVKATDFESVVATITPFFHKCVLLKGHDPLIPNGRQILSLLRIPIPPQKQFITYDFLFYTWCVKGIKFV